MKFFQASAFVLTIAASVGLGGCATTPEAMNSIQVGMTKPEVIALMGQPQSVAADGGGEYMTYSYCIDKCIAPPIARVYVPFFVRIKGGRVDAFGRKGDFDSTKTPTSRVEVDRTDRITQNVKTQDSGDMYVELKKLKELLDTGVITQQEFDAKKKQILATH